MIKLITLIRGEKLRWREKRNAKKKEKGNKIK